MNLWTASEAQEATGGRAQGDWAVTGVSIDTRTIRPRRSFRRAEGGARRP